jgi:hypothetical protein
MNYVDRDARKKDNANQSITNKYQKRKQDMLRIAPTNLQPQVNLGVDDYRRK